MIRSWEKYITGMAWGQTEMNWLDPFSKQVGQQNKWLNVLEKLFGL